ncbi:DUF2971 domain-containing protein [Priestia megaterium]|uniref:DUF2971 domain-containing protein n=1 Tax=Priestia megaterium TaxID=1404 RepID=UPI0038A2493A
MSNYIYHYTSAEALKNIVQTKAFWITRSEYLNDTTEQEVIISLLRNFYKRNNKMSKVVQGFIETKLNEFIKEYNYYILSFSNSDDSLPLWNYYAENDGYNIGFDLSEIITIMESYFKSFDEENQVVNTKVEYVDNGYTNEKLLSEIDKLLLPFIHFGEDDLNNPDKVEIIEEVVLELANKSFSIKNSAYSSEKEERIVVIAKKDSNLTKKEQFRVYQGAFIPYIIFNKENSPEYKLPIKSIKINPYHKLDMTRESLLYMLNHGDYKELKLDDISISEIPSRY